MLVRGYHFRIERFVRFGLARAIDQQVPVVR
jgi:hypothetical protein